jgi:hypothetical protein
MNKVLQAAIMGVSISLSASVASAQVSGVTMVVESVERAPHAGDLVGLDVRVTNASKDVVVFKESQISTYGSSCLITWIWSPSRPASSESKSGSAGVTTKTSATLKVRICRQSFRRS